MGELGPDDGAGNTYSLRPGLQHRFKSSSVKECIHAILKEKLANVQYNPEEMPELTKSLSETIKDRLKEEGYDRYKMVVQVVIGEQRGEGVNMAARCFWDADTDSCAHDVFMNTPVGVWMEESEAVLAFRCTDLGYTKSEDSLFCVVAAFGCFYY
ncbi:PREDICTED: tctex1 domain-containing protein 2 isoform X1 [Lepidothrix coronata]|uniref:Tctex1 domain-containing protein 2 isoform X1 n=2 Tax=Lepidothrix coronata TaxID=321398 RepID=A0A6J0GVB0_9PASS|nr:PREDICTED: tctex1 domain-containing protein 2 isoform X1 [Lepidothrix coronata]